MLVKYIFTFDKLARCTPLRATPYWDEWCHWRHAPKTLILNTCTFLKLHLSRRWRYPAFGTKWPFAHAQRELPALGGGLDLVGGRLPAHPLPPPLHTQAGRGGPRDQRDGRRARPSWSCAPCSALDRGLERQKETVRSRSALAIYKTLTQLTKWGQGLSPQSRKH